MKSPPCKPCPMCIATLCITMYCIKLEHGHILFYLKFVKPCSCKQVPSKVCPFHCVCAPRSTLTIACISLQTCGFWKRTGKQIFNFYQTSCTPFLLNDWEVKWENTLFWACVILGLPYLLRTILYLNYGVYVKIVTCMHFCVKYMIWHLIVLYICVTNFTCGHVVFIPRLLFNSHRIVTHIECTLH